ncbi:MAG: ABC transporter permease, partial [Holosporales bacterium]|nr:ABC transporter permease [Holosporales bacterium]
MEKLISFLVILGKVFENTLVFLGRPLLFALQVFFQGLLPPYYGRQIWKQILEIGYFSLPVVALTALFSGMVLALQSYTGFSRFNAE